MDPQINKLEFGCTKTREKEVSGPTVVVKGKSVIACCRWIINNCRAGVGPGSVHHNYPFLP